MARVGSGQSLSTWLIVAKGLRIHAAPFDVRELPRMRSAYVANVAMRLVTHRVIDANSVVTSQIDFSDDAAVVAAVQHYGANCSMKPSLSSRGFPANPVIGQSAAEAIAGANA
jgi:hypothetical protein